MCSKQLIIYRCCSPSPFSSTVFNPFYRVPYSLIFYALKTSIKHVICHIYIYIAFNLFLFSFLPRDRSCCRIGLAGMGCIYKSGLLLRCRAPAWNSIGMGLRLGSKGIYVQLLSSPLFPFCKNL
jgi:hypothetical protein